jgi:hypothetical protein
MNDVKIDIHLEAANAKEMLLKLRELAGQILGLHRDDDKPVPEKLPVGPTPTDTLNAGAAEAIPPEQGNGADEAPPARRTRRRAAAAAAEPPPAQEIDRDNVIRDLTEIYMRAEPAIREKIVAFRDGHGVNRLKELKDDALPGAAALLAELQALETTGP